MGCVKELVGFGQIYVFKWYSWNSTTVDTLSKVKKAQNDYTPIILPTNVRVVSGETGGYVMPLTEQILRPKAKDFLIKDLNNGFISVDIDFEPKAVKPQPLDQNKTLREFKKFSKKGMYPAHRYPKELVHTSKVCITLEV